MSAFSNLANSFAGIQRIMGKIKDITKSKVFQQLMYSRATEYFAVFVLGGALYYLMENVWRGYSHITMFAAGGLCLCLIYLGEKLLGGIKIVFRMLIYAITITVIEFIFGVVFNIWLCLDVWDYSNIPYNILGQVCPAFFFVWFAISLPAILVCKGVFYYFNKKREQVV